jgi:cellulose biosynthesis protein BcsQ
VRPIVEAVKAVREARAALQHAQHVLEANWKHLVKLVGADEQRDYRFEDPPPRGDVMTAAMMALAEHVIAGRDRKVVRARPSDGDGG